MKVFVGTTANNLHTQQIGLALHEAGMLHGFAAPMLDREAGPMARGIHSIRRRVSPNLDAKMRRRRPAGIPLPLTAERPSLALPWQILSKLPVPQTWPDLLWEKQERAFARWCARRLQRERPEVYLGTEHGALEAIDACHAAGLHSGVIFASAHHLCQQRWLDPVYKRFPGLLDSASRAIRELEPRRNRRRDEEMAKADFIHANSRFTADSLVAAGAPPEKLVTVPLGSPPAISPDETRADPPPKPVFLFAGNVSAHKGAHILLEAWAALPRGTARLDFYGHSLLPAEALATARDDVRFHGPVPHAELKRRMREASVLVLPSLCEGFGMVVSEAMSQGIPVLCSTNVGASQLVEHGRNGLIVPAADPVALADALRWCVEHPLELNLIGRAAAETARNWTWNDFRREFVRRLLEVLAVRNI